MTYFLLVYDKATGQVLEQVEFADADEAVRERFKREIAGVAPEIEVVVLGAESADALRVTHSRYFGDPAQALSAVG